MCSWPRFRNDGRGSISALHLVQNVLNGNLKVVVPPAKLGNLAIPDEMRAVEAVFEFIVGNHASADQRDHPNAPVVPCRRAMRP